MKKSTIKRRKRVVPALSDQPQDQSPQAFTTSASPEASPVISFEPFPGSPHRPPYMDIPLYGPRDGNQSRPSRSYDPPPVDFTGYQASHKPHLPPSEPEQMYGEHQQPGRAQYHQHNEIHLPSPFHPPLTIPPIHTHPGQQPPLPREQTANSQHSNQYQHQHVSHPDHGRKRSFSIAEGTHQPDSASTTTPTVHTPDSARPGPTRLSSISSILNPTASASSPRSQPYQSPRQSLLSEDSPNIPRSASSLGPGLGPSLPPIDFERSPHSHVHGSSAGYNGPTLPPPTELEMGGARDIGMEPGRDSDGGHQMDYRRSQLMKEADDLREKLRLKERELEQASR